MNSPPLRKRVKRAVRYAALRTGVAVLASLPIRFSSWLGAGFGWLAFVLAGSDRRKALASVEVAFPSMVPSQRLALVRACFRHLGKMIFELVCVEQIDAAPDAWVRWDDRSVLDAALARGKGVVFISGHVGNWELLARRVALAGYPCQTIAKETTDPRTTALIEKFRASSKLKSIWRGQPGAARFMLRALRDGQILGMLIDQDTDVQSVWVPFFGRPAKTPRAAADLALRTGAAVVVGFCQRAADGRYRVVMRELSTLGLDAVGLTAALSQQIEAAIREAPEQWVWMHRRWKSPPEAVITTEG